MSSDPSSSAAVIPHPWIGEAGQWRCSRCSAVCDHDEPCGRHGSCAPLPDSMTPTATGEPSIVELSAQMAYANEGRRLCGLGHHAWMPWLAIWVGDPLYISRYETYCVRCRHPEQFDV